MSLGHMKGWQLILCRRALVPRVCIFPSSTFHFPARLYLYDFLEFLHVWSQAAGQSLIGGHPTAYMADNIPITRNLQLGKRILTL